MQDIPAVLQKTIQGLKNKGKKKIWLYGGLGAVVMFFFAFAIAKIIFGTALIVAAVAFAAFVAFAVALATPLIIKKGLNLQIQMMLDEAEKNPIPTLLAEHEEDDKEIQELEEGIKKYDAGVMTIKDKRRDMASKLRPEDLLEMDGEIAIMEADVVDMTEELRQLCATHEENYIEIERAKAIWELAGLMEQANALAMRARREDTMDRIMKETALSAVRTKMNRGKAELKMRLHNRATKAGSRIQSQSGQTKKLEASEVQVLDLQSTTVKVTTPRN